MSARRVSVQAQPLPHSWSLESWPQHVYPHSPGRARYICRAHRNELLAAGALTRVGRDLVVFGAQYQAWLQSQTPRVSDFQIAPNRAA
jgi:hypothetical protein